jgi:hypothetical protein
VENGSRPPRKWVPDHADRAIIACLRDGTVAMELIDCGSPEGAAEADAVLYQEPCSRDCVGRHLRNTATNRTVEDHESETGHDVADLRGHRGCDLGCGYLDGHRGDRRTHLVPDAGRLGHRGGITRLAPRTQLPDGTVIWDLPGGQTYVTTPGSALLFPTLCAPTADAPKPDHARAHRITAERQHNKLIRERVSEQGQREEIPVTANDQPPPF